MGRDMYKKYIYTLFISVFSLYCLPSYAFEGKYRGAMGVVEIKKQNDGSYKVDIVAEKRKNMACGFFEGSGKIQNDRLIADVKDKTFGQCNIIITKTDKSITTNQNGSGCLSFHGASCPGFEGTFRITGSQGKKSSRPTTEQAMQQTPTSGSPARAAPYGEWSFLEPNGTCVPDAGFQGVVITPGQIVVHYMDISTFKVGPPTCRNDVCTFRIRGGKSTWTTNWLGPNQISFRGLHMLASENNKTVNQTSKAVRRGSQPGC